MVTRRGIRRTNPNGNTIGRVIGETSPMPVAAKAANPGIAPETEEEQAFLAKIGNWLAEQGENLEAAARHPFGALKGFAKDVGNTPAALLNLVSVMGVAQVGADMRTQAYSGHSGHLSPEEQQAAYEAGTRLMTNPTDVALLVDEPFPLANAAEHGGALIGNLNPKGVIRHAASNAGKNSAKSGTNLSARRKALAAGTLPPLAEMRRHPLQAAAGLAVMVEEKSGKPSAALHTDVSWCRTTNSYAARTRKLIMSSQTGCSDLESAAARHVSPACLRWLRVRRSAWKKAAAKHTEPRTNTLIARLRESRAMAGAQGPQGLSNKARLEPYPRARSRRPLEDRQTAGVIGKTSMRNWENTSPRRTTRCCEGFMTRAR